MKKTAAIAIGVILFAFCIFMGMVSVQYGEWVGDKLVRAVILPTVLILALLLIADKRKVFLLLVLIRAPIDPLFEATRFGAMSPGAVFNALIILIGLMLLLERPSKSLGVVVPMWLPLVLIMIFETARAPDFIQSVRAFLGYSTYLTIFTSAFYLRQCQNDMKFCINLVLLSSLIPVFYGFVNFAQGGYGGIYGNRVNSTFSHPNIFAFYLVVVISLTFYAIKSSVLNASTGRRWLLAVYIGIMVVDLVLTKTRSAWASCLVVFIIYGLIFERRYLIYIGVVSVVALMIPAVQDRLADINGAPVYWSYGQPQNSYEWRKMLWESAWDWMRPIDMPLGYGLGSFAYYAPEFFKIGGGVNYSAHSVYYQWLFEAGIIGLLCAAWLYFRLIFFIKSGFNEDKLGAVIVITIIIEYLVVSYSDNMLDYLAFNWYFWFVLGTACSIIAERRSSAKERDGGYVSSEPNGIHVRLDHELQVMKSAG